MFNLRTVTNKLVLINLILYVITLIIPNVVYRLFALHTFDNSWFSPIQLISYQFVHDTGPLHVLFNMMVLHVFGTMVEEKYGTSKVISFYIFSGLIAGVLHNLTISDETLILSIITNQDLTLVGASGSIWGIMALFTFLYPNEKLYLFFHLVAIKTKFLIPSFFAIEVLSAIFSSSNVSHFAHIGGAISGMTLFYLEKKNIIK